MVDQQRSARSYEVRDMPCRTAVASRLSFMKPTARKAANYSEHQTEGGPPVNQD
jgi:hypothetical protein